MANHVTFYTTGYPQDLVDFLKATPRFSKLVGPRIARKVAARFLQGLIDFWYTQKFGLAPLNPGYAAHKAAQGLDSRILIATHELVSKMQIYDVDKNNYVAGVDNTVHSIYGLPLSTIMKTLEFGSPSNNIPARPIFWLTRITLESELVNLVRDELRREAEFYFKKYLARLKSKKLKSWSQSNTALLNSSGYKTP